MISVSNFAIDTGDGNSAQKNNRVPKLVCSHKLVLRGISRPVFDCCSYSWWNQKPCQNKIPQILWTDIPVSWNKQYPISLALHAIPHQHTLHSSQKMCLMDSTIPNVFHQLQNLAHNTQHSSQIAKPCSYSTINPNTRFTKRKICICYSTHNPNTRFTERKICICYSTQYPTFFTNGKSLVANSTPIWDSPKTAKTLLLFQSNTIPDILHKKPHCHSNNTQYCCYSTPSLQFWQYPIFFTNCKTLPLFHQHSIQRSHPTKIWDFCIQKRYSFCGTNAQNCHQVSYDVAVVFLLSETNYSTVRYERIELTRSCIFGRVNKGDAYINENSSLASRMK